MRLDWYSDTTLEELGLLALAFVLSALIGMERQRKLKSAGLRTHTLVGLGSAAFTLVSAYGFSNVLGSDVALDPSRIAAQIASGIGFLGAGVIFVRKGSVSGLTTAASIWVTAAVGMACGAGMPIIATATVALHLLAVVVLTVIGRVISPEVPEPNVTVRYKPGNNVLRQVLELSAQHGYHFALKEMATDEGSRTKELTLRLAGDIAGFTGLVDQLADIKGVKSVTTGDDSDD